MTLLLKVLVYAASLWAAVQVIDGLTFDDSLLALLAIAVIFGGVNMVVRPVVKFFSFPFIIATLGLFLLLINTAMLALTIWISGNLGIQFDSDGFVPTFLGAIVVAVVAWIGESVVEWSR